MLSYSFSVECPVSQRQHFLLQAKEAFSIGLLTKAEDQLVTSKQELHTFLKASYSLTVVHKWLGTAKEVVAQATQATRRALAHFYEYDADAQDKDNLCADIMRLVSHVKLLLQVEPFLNSDKGSFIPDSFKNISDTSVNFTLEGFTKVMQRFQKYHASLCETTNTNCKGTKDAIDGPRLCITALGTTISTLNTECSHEASKVFEGGLKGEVPPNPNQKSPDSYAEKSDWCSTQGTTDELDSSWQNFSLSGSGSLRPSSSSYTGIIAVEHKASNQSCLTTEDEDELSQGMPQSTNKNQQDSQGCPSSVRSQTVLRSAGPATSLSSASSDSKKFEVMQADIVTLGSDEDWLTGVGVQIQPPAGEGAPQSLSELTLRTSSSSLSGSFSSQSSWEKILVNTDSLPDGKPGPYPNGLLRAGTGQSSKSSESDGSFFLLETLDSETSDSTHDPTHKNQTPGQSPKPLESPLVDPVTCKVGSLKSAYSIATPPPNKGVPEQCASTETSSESSFEMLGESRREVPSPDRGDVPQQTNPLCYTCLKHITAAGRVPDRQYTLSQQDYLALLAGVCHQCLLKRLHSDNIEFKLKKYRTAYSKL